MALYYLDASAIVKLVRDEPESRALRAFVDDAGLVSWELVLSEVPRAIRRAAAYVPQWPLEVLLTRAEEVLDALGLLPLDRALLQAAGALAEPALRALDAIHVAAALSLAPLDGFLSYDERQSAAARLAGMRTVSPGEDAVMEWLTKLDDENKRRALATYLVHQVPDRSQKSSGDSDPQGNAQHMCAASLGFELRDANRPDLDV